MTQAGSPLLEVDRLTIRFGGLVGLTEMSFALHRGEIVALIGPNGAGKTMLFNVLTGLVRPTAGRIFFRDTDITRCRSDRISRLGISRTFQLIRVFSGLSVQDNVRLGGIFGRAAEAPLHLAQQPASILGIGDRKRLEIARALATQPSLLLLDEIIAGVAPPDARDLTPSRFPFQ